MTKGDGRSPYNSKPGAGRPSNAERGIVAPPPDLAVFVEGRARVDPDDEDVAENLGKLRGIADFFGLVVHAIEVTSDNVNELRKSWGGRRVDSDVAAAWIVDYPGVTFLTWTEKLFLGNDPMTEVTFAAAKAKAKVALSRLWRDGRVVKGKNEYGQLTLWPPGPPLTARPKTIPAEILVEVDAVVDAALLGAQNTGKAISTRAIVKEVATIVWQKRDRFEEDRPKSHAAVAKSLKALFDAK